MCHRLNSCGWRVLVWGFLIITGLLASLYVLATIDNRIVTVIGQSTEAALLRRSCKHCVRTNTTRGCQDVIYSCYYVKVNYQYVYEQQHYKNQVEIAFDNNLTEAANYHDMVSVIGTEIEIYVDSIDPSNSDLLKSNLHNNWKTVVWVYMILFWIYLISILLFGLIYGLSIFLKPRNDDGG